MKKIKKAATAAQQLKQYINKNKKTFLKKKGYKNFTKKRLADWKREQGRNHKRKIIRELEKNLNYIIEVEDILVVLGISTPTPTPTPKKIPIIQNDWIFSEQVQLLASMETVVYWRIYDNTNNNSNNLIGEYQSHQSALKSAKILFEGSQKDRINFLVDAFLFSESGSDTVEIIIYDTKIS